MGRRGRFPLDYLINLVEKQRASAGIAVQPDEGTLWASQVTSLPYYMPGARDSCMYAKNT